MQRADLFEANISGNKISLPCGITASKIWEGGGNNEKRPATHALLCCSRFLKLTIHPVDHMFRQGNEGRKICQYFIFSQLFHPLLQFYVGCMKAFVRLRFKHSTLLRAILILYAIRSSAAPQASYEPGEANAAFRANRETRVARAGLAVRAKCRVLLAWLKTRLLCR